MGTINGMLSFNPSQFKEDTFMPPMYITGINLPDNEENKYNLPTSSIEDTKVLKLPYNASTFTLSYVALSYTSTDAIRYAYKLEGVDKDWNYMDPVSYTHLDVYKRQYVIRPFTSPSTSVV